MDSFAVSMKGSGIGQGVFPPGELVVREGAATSLVDRKGMETLSWFLEEQWLDVPCA